MKFPWPGAFWVGVILYFVGYEGIYKTYKVFRPSQYSSDSRGPEVLLGFSNFCKNSAHQTCPCLYPCHLQKYIAGHVLVRVLEYHSCICWCHYEMKEEDEVRTP